MDASLILRGGRVALGPNETAHADIAISGRRICAIERNLTAPRGARTLDLSGHVVLPGLINAHDHLEFNLYPRLGRGPYPNAGAWARDIYQPEASPVREQLRIPKNTRLFWGGLKNLLSGVTTVCHHNPRENGFFDRNFPVRVLKRFGWAHSLEFSPDVAERFRATPSGWPFILHLGEGADESTKREIFRLDKLGALDERTVLVHAVGLDVAGLRLARRRQTSIVWCPSSNLFTLGRTLSERTLLSGLLIALGSDSALTAEGDLLDEIRVARRVSGLADSTLYEMITTNAARILKLGDGAGALKVGGVADLVALSDAQRSPAAALLRAKRPALVIINGKVKLISTELGQQPGLSRLRIEDRGEFLVDAKIPRAGRDQRLAGRRILP